ncbi:LOW QUALITY PROTEIN: arrestin domain-containing protein 5 [Excalfactoria chinensis]|uniref:LOW QUALITY PROTEIN: arrestin domain-containing protein 5 n=1 Tax=Excalfactoria chinensis TaxID=46218 RepID=UPI003B3A7612
MTVVKTINLVLPETEVYSAGSSTCGQLVLKLSSTFVDPAVKVERMERGYLRWDQEGHPELEYEKITACTKKDVCISKAKKMHFSRSALTSVRKPSENMKEDTDLTLLTLNTICPPLMLAQEEYSCLDSGIHTFDFHFSFPPEVPSTLTSKVCCISYFFSVILQICLEKNLFSRGKNVVFTVVIASRTCNYIRKELFSFVLALSGNNIMAFKYELVETANLPHAMFTIFGRVPIIIPATSKHLWSRAP